MARVSYRLKARERMWGEAGGCLMVLSAHDEPQKTLDDFLIAGFNLASDNVRTYDGRMDPLG